MTCWRCQGRGEYRCVRFYALSNEYRIVEKECGCRAKTSDFPYEDEMRGGKIDEATRCANSMRPLTNVTRNGAAI